MEKVENINNIVEFIKKYKNKFEKRKYFLINKDYKIEKREPSFIIELANLYFETKNEKIIKEISYEFENTYVEKDKKINRMSKIEKDRLIDSFRRALVNQDKLHSVKLGNELLLRDRYEFFRILYNISLISQDCNKLVKTYFIEKVVEKVYELNGESFNQNCESIQQIVKNVINYFVKSENIYLDYDSESEIQNFIENKVDKLYMKIYNKIYDEIIEKYDIMNVSKLQLKNEIYYNNKELSKSKTLLFEFLK